MNKISVSYTLKWQHKTHPQYQLSICKKMFNVNRGKLVKCVVNGGAIGWWIAGKFLPKSKVNDNFELIKEVLLLF